jgi:hypothetical protein
VVVHGLERVQKRGEVALAQVLREVLVDPASVDEVRRLEGLLPPRVS